MPIIAIAGMPGSGKSTLMGQYETAGYVRYDDFNVDWAGNLEKAGAALAQQKNLIVSDIEFCREEMRRRFEKDIGQPVQWIFFENNPFQCAKNVLYRAFVERRPRPWGEECHRIHDYTKQYLPFGDVRPVMVTPL